VVSVNVHIDYINVHIDYIFLLLSYYGIQNSSFHCTGRKMRHSRSNVKDFNDDDDDDDNNNIFYYFSCPTSFIGTAYESLLHNYTVVFTLSREVCISLFRPPAYLTFYYDLFLSNKITQTCSHSPI